MRSLKLLWVLRVIYVLGFNVFKQFVHHFNSDVTLSARNSFAEGIYLPGVSDIDMTAKVNLFEQDNYDFLMKYHKIFKYFFPFLGEINFYESSQLTDLQISGNIFEKDRDPSLIQKEMTSGRMKCQAVVFILRLAWTDLESLLDPKKKKVYKWDYAFSLINSRLKTKLELDKYTLDEVLEKLPNIDTRITREDINHLNYLLRNKKSLTNDPYYREFYPNYWLGDNWSRANFRRDINDIKKLEEKYRDIILEQVSWEIFGIYSQLYSLIYEFDIRAHFGNLIQILDTYEDNEVAISLKKEIELIFIHLERNGFDQA